jgi:tripartite-type tricarboxylate transporter receptor subunit TctC
MAAVRADNAATSLAEVVRQARGNPNFVVSTTAQFSVPHLAVDLLSQAAGTPIRAVPFSNSGQSITAVVNGDAQMMIDGVPPIDPMIKGGRLKAVAIFADERLPKRAALATAAETYPGLVINGWFGVLAPNGTSAKAQARVHADISAILAQPDVVERLDGLGVYPRSMSQAQFADFVARERGRWEQVLRNVGAKPLQE